MAIVKLTKSRDQAVSELLKIFKLPCSNPVDVKQRGPEPVGGSAITDVERTRLHAVNELRRWTRLG